MGGNLFKDKGARRFTKEEYEPLAVEVLERLSDSLDYGVAYQEIPYYKNKPSFGDMDVIIAETGLKGKEWDINSLPEMFEAEVFHTDSSQGTCSILYKGLQVDFIIKPVSEFFTSIDYYSYNDLGNLLSKIFRKLGLKYGHRGLIYQMMYGTHMFDEIMVSTNTKLIHQFLGLDHSKFLARFNDLEDIFEYVISSPKFNPEIYRFEELNSANRIRDRKRATYNAFLTYIGVYEGAPPEAVKWNFGDREFPTYERGEDKAKYLPEIFSHFPTFQEKYEASLSKLRKEQEWKAKYNGENVAKWVKEVSGDELSGPGLGKFMKYLKVVCFRTYWTLQINQACAPEVEAWVKAKYQAHKLV